MERAQKARCVHCRTDVLVPDSYAHGDHIKCGSCGTKHKVVRADTLRLVLADVSPLREALQENERLVERLEDELRGARHSFGIGVNGIGIGVLFALWQVALREQAWSTELLSESVGIALISGALLEAANHLFLSKRQRITRLSAEVDEARTESRRLEKMIREATRV
jgi:hypothetical protein